MILDRSPEFCLKPLIDRYLLKTGHVPGDPLMGPFLSLDLYLEQIEIWSTGWYYILNIRALEQHRFLTITVPLESKDTLKQINNQFMLVTQTPHFSYLAQILLMV